MLSDHSVPNLTPQQKTGRIGYIDLTKGLVLILVIISHTDIHWLTDPVEAFRLPLLFLCSGYTSRPDFNAPRRIGRFFRSYIILSVICLAYTLIMSPHSIGSDALLGVVYNRYYIADNNHILLNMSNSVLWFLGALMIATLLFFIMLKLRSVFQQSLLAIVYFTIGYAMTYLPFLLPHSLDTAFFFAPIIWIGYLLRKYDVINRMTPAHIAILIAIYIVSTWHLGLSNFSIRDYGTSYILAIISGLSGSVAFMKLCTYLDKVRPLNIIKVMNYQAVYVFGMQLIFIGLTQILVQTYITSSAKVVIPLQIIAACVGGYLTGRLIMVIKAKLFRKSAVLKK